jgi:signal transduction histidine kinase
MTGTTITDRLTAAACAVFKIDLRGRFVYVDDETEELIGLSREELFGKSIHDFIAGDSLYALERLLARHNRYESFYQALPLTIRTHDRRDYQRDAVVTLNFFGGNPVNYQFILIPTTVADARQRTESRPQFTDLIKSAPERLDFNALAEFFRSIGGYATAQCILPDESGNPAVVGMAPFPEPECPAPETLPLLEKSSGDDDEVLLRLWYNNGPQLTVRVSRPVHAGQAAAPDDNVRFWVQLWNGYFQASAPEPSAGDRLSTLGAAGDGLNISIVVVDGNCDIIYQNQLFTNRFIGTAGYGSVHDLRRIFSAESFRDLSGRPFDFDHSPLADAVAGGRCLVPVTSADTKQTMLILGGSLELGVTRVTLYAVIETPPETDEACAGAPADRQFVLSLIHDIRAPLIAMEAFARRVQANHGEELPHDAKFAVDCLVENGRILHEMLEGLDELSRSWTDNEPLEMLSTGRLINDLTTQLRATYPYPPVRVVLPDNLPDLPVPRRKFTRLIRNLMDNAFKFASSSLSPLVVVEYARAYEEHCFSIIDNGPGIAAEYRRKVFDPFFRTPEAMHSPGSGLGLTIARDIVLSWAGRIWLDDAIRGGAKISFTVPCKTGG